MRKKQTKKKNSLGLGSKISQLGKKNCPLAKKSDEELNYKNIKLLKKYISENGKILSSKITSVSYGKQKKLTREIKKAKILGLL